MKIEVFTPENIKANKADILYFLKKIYDNPNQYSEYISYMDPLSLGIEHTYGVIQAINAIIKKEILFMFLLGTLMI